jgi:hypothetical protein
MKKQGTVEFAGGLKKLIVDYVGEAAAADEEVTVDMAVEVFAKEFPEFLLSIASENFLRGYEQALCDVENQEKADRCLPL